VPTRKQRRRQQKLRRHEYEEVYVDAEGNVVDVDGADQPEPSGRRNGRTATRPARAPARAPRTGRTIQPPSVRRALKRGLLFGPVMFILISILPGGGDITLLARVVNTLMLLAIFLPFSYVMDTVTYRIWLRRTGRAAPGRGKSS
jgi:hypothetical protein